MKNVVGTMIFCASFVSAVFAAESPEQFPFIRRGKVLGDTGALSGPGSPRPSRANSSSSGKLKRAETIRVTLPKKTSNEGEKVFHKSPRYEGDFYETRNEAVDLPAKPFDFSKPAEPKKVPSYELAEKK